MLEFLYLGDAKLGANALVDLLELSDAFGIPSLKMAIQ